MAMAIAKAESGMRCDAVSPTSDFGPMQINIIHKWRGNIYDCTENLLIAKQIFDEQGWNPWVTFKNERYKNYID